jgi:hypothetical protein
MAARKPSSQKYLFGLLQFRRLINENIYLLSSKNIFLKKDGRYIKNGVTHYRVGLKNLIILNSK